MAAGDEVRTAVVVAGGGPPAVGADTLARLGPDVVVAADSGLDHALALGLTVDAVVGDMDSVAPGVLARARAAGVAVERHPVAKDATDLDLAVDVARAAGAGRLVVVTGAGDRFDHALGVALSLATPRLAEMAVEGWVGPAHLWVVRDEVRLPGAPGDVVSLFALHGPALGVATSGLRYPLAGETLAPGSTRGVSNEWTAPEATVRVRSGVVLAVAPAAAHRADPPGG